MGKIFKWLVLTFVGLIGVGMWVESNKTPEQRAWETAERQRKAEADAETARRQAEAELATLPSYTAAQIASAYSENTVAADSLFKGKKFKVSGTVKDINTDLFGNPYLVLRGGVNQFLEPQFGFDGTTERLAKLRKGMKVNLICVGRGDIAKTPMSDDCIIL